MRGAGTGSARTIILLLGALAALLLHLGLQRASAAAMAALAWLALRRRPYALAAVLATALVAVLATALVAWFVVLDIVPYAMGDMRTAYHPWHKLSAREIAAGRLPLWTPHTYLGLPHLGNTQTQVLYPPVAALLYAGASYPAREVALDWLQLLVAGAGATPRALRLTGGPPSRRPGRSAGARWSSTSFCTGAPSRYPRAGDPIASSCLALPAASASTSARCASRRGGATWSRCSWRGSRHGQPRWRRSIACPSATWRPARSRRSSSPRPGAQRSSSWRTLSSQAGSLGWTGRRVPSTRSPWPCGASSCGAVSGGWFGATSRSRSGSGSSSPPSD